MAGPSLCVRGSLGRGGDDDKRPAILPLFVVARGPAATACTAARGKRQRRGKTSAGGGGARDYRKTCGRSQ